MIVLALIMLATCRDRHYYWYKRDKRLPNRAIFKVRRLQLREIRKLESRTDFAEVKGRRGEKVGFAG